VYNVDSSFALILFIFAICRRNNWEKWAWTYIFWLSNS